MEARINLRDFGGPVFVGRSNGAAVREQLNLNAADKTAEQIIVAIPDDTYSVNSSFFLGLFGPSISFFGSRDAFLNHYRLDAPQHVLSSLEELIERTLMSRGPLQIA
jgi:hypothetical protein